MPLAKAIAQTIFKRMVGKGIGRNALIRMAQRQGGTYRRIEMLDDIRKYEGHVKYQPLIEKLGFNQKVPRAWMVETDLGNKGKYRVFGTANFYDEDIDDYYEQTVSFYTDDYSPTGEYGMAFGDYYTGQYKEQDLEFIDFTQTGLEHNSKWDY